MRTYGNRFSPITDTAPASKYFGIDASITYGDAPILANNAGIVDTGATFIEMATGAYLACSECSSSD